MFKTMSFIGLLVTLTACANKPSDYPVVAQERLAGDYKAISACTFARLEANYPILRYTPLEAQGEARIVWEVAAGNPLPIFEARFIRIDARSTEVSIRFIPTAIGQSADIATVLTTAKSCV